MYNETYDDYINSILGYQRNDMYIPQNQPIQMYNNSELEDYYPEIYKIVYPMIIKTARSANNEITKEAVDTMTDEIYANIEGNTETRISNNGLRDLIRILLIRELINRGRFPFPTGPQRPPFPVNRPPMRPPFGPRPPFPRDFESSQYGIYEI